MEKKRIMKLFRFEVMWLHQESTLEIMIRDWTNVGGLNYGKGLKNKINNCSMVLSFWKNLHFGKIRY